MSVLGIDGGGTHTRIELRTQDNQLLFRETFGPFNMAAIGEAGFRQRLWEIFQACGSMENVTSICVGGAGSSGGAMEVALRQELTKAGFRGRLTVCGDHEIALEGAVEGPGCVLIAGTGSICCGRNDSGDLARCGGWGHILDDGGSAYTIGREALSAVVRTEDGRLPENALYPAVLSCLKGKSSRDVIDFVYYSNSDKAKIAALAPIVISCAASGDSVSREILAAQAMHLRELVAAVRRRLALPKPRVALLGGLLEHENYYSTLVRRNLEEIAILIPPAQDACWGAAQIAWQENRMETSN